MVASGALGAADYAVAALLLLLSAAIGVYFGLCAGARSANDYLLGGRRMAVGPVALSLLASAVSGNIMLGIPTEVYVFGGQQVYSVVGFLVMGVVFCFAYLPTLHELRLTSVYEYLELRFDRRVRALGSLLFTVSSVLFLPVVMYVPALVFNQMSGISMYAAAPIFSLVCIFYTCVGGLRAVVWTDVAQAATMFASLLAVLLKGTADAGGAAEVWRRGMASGRIETPNWSPDPTVRHTFWSLAVGGLFHLLAVAGTGQGMLQRYMALPSLGQAKLAAGIFVLGSCVYSLLCCFTGLVIYANFWDCDPLTAKAVSARDQLLPLLVMRSLGELPGLPGLFMAGVLSAALSTMSTMLNALAAVALEDVYKPWLQPAPSERRAALVLKGSVLAVGLVCTALMLLVERLGTVLQVGVSLPAIGSGPLLGVFSAGLFFPYISATGALLGSGGALLLMGWLVLSAQAAIAAGRLSFPAKPVGTAGCGLLQAAVNLTTAGPGGGGGQPQSVPALYRLSFRWYTLLGCALTVAIALVASWAAGGVAAVPDRRLLSPLVRRLVPASASPPSGQEGEAEGRKPTPGALEVGDAVLQAEKLRLLEEERANNSAPPALSIEGTQLSLYPQTRLQERKYSFRTS